MDKLIIIQRKAKGKNDSFWYDGNIAFIGKYLLIATGYIKVTFPGKTEETLTGTHAVSEAESRLWEDKHLKLIVQWDNNNWFEVTDKESNESVLGDVAFGYDEGIKLLKQYHREKMFG